MSRGGFELLVMSRRRAQYSSKDIWSNANYKRKFKINKLKIMWTYKSKDKFNFKNKTYSSTYGAVMNVCLDVRELSKAVSMYALTSSGSFMLLVPEIDSGKNHPIFIRGSHEFSYS